MRRRRLPLVVRLARVDRELSDAARMLDMITDDMRDVLASAQETAEQVTLLLAVAGTLLLAAGVGPSLVAAWLMVVQSIDDQGEAGRLTGEVIEQMVVLHALAEGEA